MISFYFVQVDQTKDPDEKRKLMFQLEQLAADIPNRKHPQAPVGDESCAKLVKMVGQPQADDKIRLPVVQFAENAGWLRMSNLGISTGQRSYFLQGQFACLEQALIRFTLDRLRDRGFQLVSVPEILKPEIIEGIFAWNLFLMFVYVICQEHILYLVLKIFVLLT